MHYIAGIVFGHRIVSEIIICHQQLHRVQIDNPSVTLLKDLRAGVAIITEHRILATHHILSTNFSDFSEIRIIVRSPIPCRLNKHKLA